MDIILLICVSVAVGVLIAWFVLRSLGGSGPTAPTTAKVAPAAPLPSAYRKGNLERGMDLALVKRFIALPADSDTWSVEQYHSMRTPGTFMSIERVGIDEIVLLLNAAISDHGQVSCSRISRGVGGDFVDRIEWKDRTEEIESERDPDDSIRAVIALSTLLAGEIELRFCRDSLGNSDLCYLPLTPATWAELAAEFGDAAVDRRFRKLPTRFEEFLHYLEAGEA